MKTGMALPGKAEKTTWKANLRTWKHVLLFQGVYSIAVPCGYFTRILRTFDLFNLDLSQIVSPKRVWGSAPHEVSP
jgi:uncharacterized membrane protein